MKKSFSLVLAALTFSSAVSMASSQDTLVCKTSEGHREITVTLAETSARAYQLSIYRVIAGRALPTETVKVSELPGSRGAVVAFGNDGQKRILRINLNGRVANSVAMPAEFVDVSSRETLRLQCQ
jgi:hypothetical protein